MTLWATDPDVPGLVVWLAGLLGCAVVVGRRDPWLGAFVGWAALGTVWAPATADPMRVATMTALGAMGLLVVRVAPSSTRKVLVGVLVGVAVVEVAYQIGQQAGWDPLWPGRPYTDGRYPGTLGSPTWLGALLALAGALAPPVVLPVILGGLWLAQAKLGCLALLVALLWRAPSAARLLAAAGAFVAAGWFLLTQSWDSLHVRLAVWRLALEQWWRDAPLLGFGPGAWWTLVPGWQEQAQVYPAEHFRKAHHEVLQVAMEHGLIGLALLIGWGWAHRALWRRPQAGACAALVVLSLGGFPFRVAETALPALLVLGLATAAMPEAAHGSWEYWV